MREAPIIESLLDTDFYKFTMGQSVLYRFGRPPESDRQHVRYALTCRTKDARLAELVDEGALREQLAHVRTLRFWHDELTFLHGTGHFDAIPYLDFLGGLSLPEPEIERIGDGYRLEVEGDWCQTILWETYVLSIVNELYGRGLARERGLDPEKLWDEGDRRLEAKIARLKGTEAKIVEFGTRRRWCRDWQEHVVNVLSAKLPAHLVGTSNVALAKRYGLKPIGTMAHELFMVQAAMAVDDVGLRATQGDVLDIWNSHYGDDLSIALTDTFGSDAFFRDFAGERARSWQGLRHDSGDPVAFGERVIAFYERQGIDPKSKSLVFSDGLDIDAVLDLQARFADRIRLSFGWGTSLTNDVGLPTLSLVMKAVAWNGRPTVKLSDDAGKHCGPPDEVARYQRVFS
jgi:nicotinate phosphoribosyltransferase